VSDKLHNILFCLGRHVKWSIPENDSFFQKFSFLDLAAQLAWQAMRLPAVMA